MTNKQMQYIDQICREIKNVLIDRTYYEIEHIHVSLDWYKGEEPHLTWIYHGKNENDVTIPESEGEEC